MPTSSSKKERPERLALNLFDLKRVPPQSLLAGKLDLATPITVNAKKPDEKALVLVCDLLTAACACDLVRNADRKAGDKPTRAYLLSDSGWKKLPDGAVLTEVEGGEPVLSEEFFPKKAEPVTAKFATTDLHKRGKPATKMGKRK